MKILHLLIALLFFSFSFSQGFSDIGKKKYNNVYAAIIGISDYNEVQDLEFADNDAQLFYDILNISFPDFKQNFTLIQNDQANERAIKQAIYSAQKLAKEGDLVIIYFSGHGDVMLEPGAEEGFFLAHDASDSREYFIGGAIEFDWINKMTNLATSRKADVWLVTDACHAGKVINQESVKATLSTLNSSFEKTTKFISCQAHELSYEYASIQHGAFTYFLAKCLSGEGNSDGDGTLNVDEISSYLKKEVRAFTENKQSPKLSTSDEFSPFINVSPDVASLIKTIDENANSDMASRGKGIEEGTKSKELVQFEKALYEGKLYGSSSSAKKLLQVYKTKLGKKELEIMNTLLLDAILNRAQRNTNLFVSGRAMVGPNENLELIVSDLDAANKMLGEKHFMYQELVDKKAFFQAMIILQNGETKKYDEAEEIILRLQSKYPNAAYLNQGLGMLYIKKSDKQKAEEQLSQASKKVSTWTKPMNSSAYLSIIEGKLDVASQKIAASEKLDENKDNTYLLKAHLHSAGYELQNAEKALKAIKNEEGNITSAELLALEGKINELRGRITVAQKMYQKSLNEEQDNVDLLMRMGNLYKNERDTVTALTFFRKVAKLKPTHQGAIANIALLKNQTVTIDNTLIDASNVRDVLLMVDVLENKKEYTKAVSLLQRSIAVVNWNPELYYELGKMQYSAGDKVASMQSIQKAIEISPYHFKSIRSLAYMYLGEKKNREADALIKKHDVYFKRSAKYLALSYQVYRQIDSRRDLYPLLERAIELDSLETDAYKALYQLHIEDNRFGEALREFQNLINIGGGYKDSVDFYNRVEKQVKYRIELHAYEGLKEGLKIILDQDPYNFEMSYFMGLVLYIEGDYASASKYLRKFNKDIQAFSPGVQRTYYQLKAKINLETGHPDLAYRLFGMSASRNEAPNYLGLAMAQFDLGQVWIDNFRRSKGPMDFNEDAIKRYEKMRKKAAKMGGSYGGAERNRR